MSELTRRDLLKATAAAGSAVVASWFSTRPVVAESTPQPAPVAAPGTYSYFTQAEAIFLDAALSRLIPADALGPGAKEAGGTFFIDQQMAGAFGRGESWYMQGPWKDGTEQQGYQLKLTPAQLYRLGIKGTEDYCQHTFGGKNFSQLDAATQDKVLHGLEKGEIELTGVPAKEFFAMLWQNTHEGFFADPMYGGNRDFAGWKLIGFPGPRYNYTDEILQFGKPYVLPPVGLMGRGGVPVRKS